MQIRASYQHQGHAFVSAVGVVPTFGPFPNSVWALAYLAGEFQKFIIVFSLGINGGVNDKLHDATAGHDGHQLRIKQKVRLNGYTCSTSHLRWIGSEHQLYTCFAIHFGWTKSEHPCYKCSTFTRDGEKVSIDSAYAPLFSWCGMYIPHLEEIRGRCREV